MPGSSSSAAKGQASQATSRFPAAAATAAAAAGLVAAMGGGELAPGWNWGWAATRGAQRACITRGSSSMPPSSRAHVARNILRQQGGAGKGWRRPKAALGWQPQGQHQALSWNPGNTTEAHHRAEHSRAKQGRASLTCEPARAS